MKVYFEESFPTKPSPKRPLKKSFKLQIIAMILVSVFLAFAVYLMSQVNIIFALVLAGLGVLALHQWGKYMDILIIEDLDELI